MMQLTAPALVSMLVAVLLSACSENKEPDAATPAETAQSRQEAEQVIVVCRAGR